MQILKIETTGDVLSCVFCQAQHFLLVVEVALRGQMLSWNGSNGVSLTRCGCVEEMRKRPKWGRCLMRHPDEVSAGGLRSISLGKA